MMPFNVADLKPADLQLAAGEVFRLPGVFSHRRFCAVFVDELDGDRSRLASVAGDDGAQRVVSMRDGRIESIFMEDILTGEDFVSKHFQLKEFACNSGCGLMNPVPELIRGLELLRTLVNANRPEGIPERPIIINSACRCPEQNALAKGAKHSEHLVGEAADIEVPGIKSWQLYALAIQVPLFHGFGVSMGSYIHVDVRKMPAKWCYAADGHEIPWVEPPAATVKA